MLKTQLSFLISAKRALRAFVAGNAASVTDDFLLAILEFRRGGYSFRSALVLIIIIAIVCWTKVVASVASSIVVSVSIVVSIVRSFIIVAVIIRTAIVSSVTAIISAIIINAAVAITNISKGIGGESFATLTIVSVLVSLEPFFQSGRIWHNICIKV